MTAPITALTVDTVTWRGGTYRYKPELRDLLTAWFADQREVSLVIVDGAVRYVGCDQW